MFYLMVRYMRKKQLLLTIVFVFLSRVILPSFLYVEAGDNSTKQPEVCNWPSKMMSEYFNFQREMKSVLLWSEMNEKRFNTSNWNWWLFSKWNLKLPSALDFLASDIVWKAKSNVSVAGTSIVLLVLVSVSVFQSNTEWLAILFKDRPIVRDYKTMLDIETELFDVAYFLSKQINLTFRLEWKDVYDNLNRVIEGYQKSWLLSKETVAKLNWSETVADILEELIAMNTSMKHFILFLWKPWVKALKNYNWCFWNLSRENCEAAPILKFSQKAIDELQKDYSWLWNFGVCNLYFSNFKKTISKWRSNNTASVKAAIGDVKDALQRLKWALIGKWAWSFRNSRKNMCDNISEYEMAQLRAYRWPDWTCWKFVDVSSNLSEVWGHIKNKTAQNEQIKKPSTVTTNAAAKTVGDDVASVEKSKGDDLLIYELKAKEKDVGGQKNIWFEEYWMIDGKKINQDTNFNSEFLFGFADQLMLDYADIMWEYNQSQQNASSSDLSYELKKIRWLLEQVDSAISAAIKADEKTGKDQSLLWYLRKIADYQCQCAG